MIEDPDYIRVGQKLRLPTQEGERIYVVQKGDSLWRIAQKYGTTVAALANLNRLSNTDCIREGMKLRIS